MSTQDEREYNFEALRDGDPACDPSEEACYCEPCPGRGNDGHGMTHCAECCWGTRVVAEMDCPTHGIQGGDR